MKKTRRMIEPPIGSLLEKVDTISTIVVAAAKRARQLTQGVPKPTNCESEKSVTIAINEIDESKITYIRTKSGIK